MAAPTSPSSSAATVASALLRTAAASSGVDGGVVAQAGAPATRPAYQPPYMAVAPSVPRISIIGIVTSHATAPCSIAVSARRAPALRAGTQPPATNAKNAPATLEIIVINRMVLNVILSGPASWAAPTAYPISPIKRST